MAVTPLVASYRVTINYVVDTFTHKHQVLCAAVTGATASGWQFVTFDATTQDVNTAVQAYCALFAACMPTGASQVTTFDLEHYSGGAYTPVYSNAVGLNGSNGAVRSEACRVTTVYRDAALKRVKFVALALAAQAPQHLSIAGVGGAFGALWNDFVNHTTTHIGNWAVGRSNTMLVSALNYTVSLDRKTRRRQGFI